MLWLLLVIILLVLLIPTAYAGWIGAPYAPTRIAPVKKAFVQLNVGKGDVLIDLGSGDGKIVREAAQRGAKASGWELSPIFWLIGWLRTRRYPQASIVLTNFYKRQLPAETTIVFAFLMPENMPKIRSYLAEQRVPHGKYFIAYAFPFKDVAPLRVIREPKCAGLYVYSLGELTEQA